MISIRVVEDAAAAEQFSRAAQAQVTPPPFQPAGLCLYAQEQVIAGVCGYLTPYWLYVDVLWVAEQQRGQQLGSRLMDAFEQAAVQRGIGMAFLGTAEFQARPFYARRGYEVTGSYTVGGQPTHIMRKVLAAAPAPDLHIQVPLDGAQYESLQAQLAAFNRQFVDELDPAPLILAATDAEGQIVGGIQAGVLAQDVIVGMAWTAAGAAAAKPLLDALEMHAAGRQILFRTDDPVWARLFAARGYHTAFTLERFPNERATTMFLKPGGDA